MEELAGVDRAGRIVIPKVFRKAAGIDEGTKVIITMTGEGRIVIQKLDVKSIAARLERELAGKDVDEIAGRIRKEISARIRKTYPDLSP